MEISEAQQLIEKCIDSPLPQTWADLGCGSGVFTRALHRLLPPGSHIYAIDRTLQHFTETPISFLQLDFETQALPFEALDGILIANALHYIKNPLPLLQQLHKQLTPAGRLVIVEYDTTTANTWVPHPLAQKPLEQLLMQSGYTRMNKVAGRRSIYNNAIMYVMLATKQ